MAGILAAFACLGLGACAPLPFLYAPKVRGQVVDAETGAPIAGAIVVVRVDARYDELLPDRDLVGHLETTTDAGGRFEAGPIWKPGISVWPVMRTEARILGVMHEGYRCARPTPIRAARGVQIPLAQALDLVDRRGSCRPIPARAQEAPLYLAAWNALFPPDVTPEALEREQQLARLLEARAAFGFGENCEGPITDLALAPGGARAAYVDRAGGVVDVVSLDRRARRVARIPLPPLALAQGAVDTRRLAWTAANELVLWEPASRLDRSRSLSLLSASGGPPQVVWSAGHGSASAPSGGFARPTASRQPLDPADLNDEGDALWLGRAFALRRSLDAERGLTSDLLHITEEDGQTREIALPGEACGPRGQFGRPHYRIAADARTALDLRHVRGACHAVAIDLETGAWGVLDTSAGAASCREARRIPTSELRVALRGYAREIDSALARAGADPDAAFVLELEADGSARAVSRSYEGETRSAPLPPFPIATPLRRIDITALGGGAPRDPTPAMQSLPDAIEPL